jgi:hypothetical protein
MIAFAECLFFESPVVVITRDAILVSRYYNLFNIVKRRATTFRLFLRSGNIQKNK